MFDDSGRRRVEQRRKAEPEPEAQSQLRPRHEPNLRCITRFDYGRCNAWWVRFQRAGSVRSRMFSDSAYGGKDASLRAAIAWRDRTEPTVPRPVRTARPVGTGRVYRDVRSYPDLQTGKLVYYACWAVWLRLLDGRAASTAYSIKKHGEKRAQQMARDWLKARRGT